MGNTHDSEIARIEADFIKTKYRSQGDYRWGYAGDRGTSAVSFVKQLVEVIRRKTASPPRTNCSVVFAGWRQYV